MHLPKDVGGYIDYVDYLERPIKSLAFAYCFEEFLNSSNMHTSL